MRNRFVKLASVFTLLAVILTGCSLVTVDPVMQADEDMKALEKDYSTPVATYDGGVITKFDVMSDFYNQYAYLYYIYSMYGQTLDQSQAEGILQGVTEAHMNTRATILKAQELGIELTDEEIAQCEADAKAAFDDAYANAYESAEGDTEEIRKLNTDVSLYNQGVSYDVLLNQQKWTLLIDKVEAVVKADVKEISEEDLERKLTEQAIADESTYSANLSAFETDMNDPSKVIVWMPEGYRTVKHILVIPEADVLKAVTDARAALTTAKTALDTLNSELTAAQAEGATDVRPVEEIQADIDAKQAEAKSLEADAKTKEDACIASVQAKLDEIYMKLDEGESFDAVMAEYGEDPGMKSEPAMTQGYYVSAASTTWDLNFRDAAMTLSGVGEYSAEPVISSSGVHIVYYNSDVVAGQVPMASIRDRFYDVALTNAQDDYMAGKVAEWVAALHPQYDYSKFFK